MEQHTTPSQHAAQTQPAGDGDGHPTSQQSTTPTSLSTTTAGPARIDQPAPNLPSAVTGYTYPHAATSAASSLSTTANGQIQGATNTGNAMTPMTGYAVPPAASNAAAPTSTNTTTDTPVWQEYQTSDGRKYYHNRITGVTQWERPSDAAIEYPSSFSSSTSASAGSATSSSPSVWQEYTDPQGRKYYYNTQTRVTQWEMPEEFRHQATQPQQQQQQQQQSKTTTTTQDRSQNNTANDDEKSKRDSLQEQLDLKPMKPIDNVKWKEEKEKISPAPVKVAQTYKTKEEAYEAFWQLLEETEIGDDWDWETTMKKIITDPRYAAMRTHRERRDAFYRFIEQRRKKRHEENRAKRQKARKNFIKMLEDTPQITSRTRLLHAEQMLGRDERWLAVEDEEERMDLYREHLRKLRRQERQEAREKFIAVLEQKAEEGAITASSSLHRIKDQIDEDLYRSLDRDDLVDVWKVFMRKLRRKEDEEKEKERYRRRKQERKDRDAFLQLLRDLSSQGRITVQTKWKDIEQELADNEVMQAMKKSTRYNPRELFDDNMEQLEEQYKLDKRRIKTVAADAGFTITPSTTFEEFSHALANDTRTNSVDKQSFRIIFEDLQQRAIHREERRREKQIDRFKEMLKKCASITSTTTWEEIRPSLADDPAFVALEAEEERKRLFDRYIAKLKRKEERRMRKRRSTEGSVEGQEQRDGDGGDADEPAAKKPRLSKEEHESVKGTSPTSGTVPADNNGGEDAAQE